MAMMQQFHLGDVLSITTGRLVSLRHMKGVYEILNFMTGDDLFTHQLPRAADECRPYLAMQFPQLVTPKMDFAVGELIEMLRTKADKEEISNIITGWLSKLTSGKYGIKCEEMLTVSPIPKDAHQQKDSIEELVDMVGADRVVVVGID